MPMQLETLNDVLREVSARDGVILADLAAELDLQVEDFDDPMRYSWSGGRKLADYFSTTVAAALRSKGSDRQLEDSTSKRVGG